MSIKHIDNIIDKVELKNGTQLILRKATVDDANDIIEYLNTVGGESNNLLFGEGEFKLTIDQERAYIENINKDKNSLMLLGVIDNRIVSVSQISSENRQRIGHNSELAISVIKEYWGNRVGSFVIEQLIKFAKDNKSIKNISLCVKEDNHNAIKLYKRHGFVEVGIHKNFFNINGDYYDEILMDLYI
ncbi:GNAT family N-acetyltransferase [Clostridium botulinum]|nr:GNAT family N-acetyltransferase [Clostridium botulinum]